METTKITCEVCGTEENILPINPNHFNRVCHTHTDFSQVFNLDIIKLKLGIIDRIPDYKCSVCGELLSEKEKEAVSAHDFNTVCSEHREYKNWYNLMSVKSAFKEGNALPMSNTTPKP